MSIRKLSQILLSVSLIFAAVFSTTASAQDVASHVMPFVPSRVTERVDDNRRVKLEGNTHPMARAASDRGLVEAGLPMERIMLVLKRSPEQEAALAAFDERLYDPNSPDFHHWMTPEQFGRAYGPSDADIATVTGWLERHGFQIYDVSKGRVTIQFSGTTAQVQEAFHVEMHNYMVNGHAHIANDRDPEIPEALSPVVKGIASLHNFFPVHQSRLGRYVTRDPLTHKITPVGTPATGVKPNFVFTDPNSGDTSEDIAPYDFATIYNVLPLWNAGYTGKGLSVAISSQTDLNLADITTFRKTFGLSGFAGTVTQIINGADPGIVAADQVENTLDTEWSGATAPDAKVIVVSSKGTMTTDAGTLSTEYIIDNNIAPIMSASYGECEAGLGSAGNSSTNSLYQQGSTEGISLFESSGDQGSTGCDNSDATTFPAPAVHGLQVNGLASSPYITAVGGTDFAWQTSPTSTYWNATNASGTQSNAIGYIPEIPWNSTCTSPFLLNAFNGETSNEQLCNDAASSSNYDHLVQVVAGSGGKSACLSNSGTFSSCTGAYAKPSWQKGTGVPADGVRDLPDLSLFASGGYPGGIPGSAYLICVSSNSPDKTCDFSGDNIIYQEVGGTSVSSPAMAGIAALILQKVGGSNLGLINPVLYQLAATENLTNCDSGTVGNSNSCLFYDVTTGTNAMVCTAGSIDCVVNTAGDQYGIVSGYTSTKGYDLVTGLGSINVSNLANAWPASSATSTLSFSPTTLTFPSTAVGSTSAAASVTVKNTGTAAVNITNIQLTGSTAFGSTSTTCTSSLAAGASCTVSLTFAPASAGTFTATLTFSDSATGSPQTVNISGTGTSGGTSSATFTPSSLSFPSTPVGTTSGTTATATFKNTGSSTLTISNYTLTGGGASSFGANTTCGPVGSTVAAGASCTFTFSFDPQTAGALTATFGVVDGAGTQSVTLSGTGGSGSTAVTITPSSLTFPSTTVGSTSAGQMITLTNNTSAAISFGGTTVTGSGASSFLRTTTCSSTLAPGASCTNTVSFKPTAAGTLTATVTYMANGNPQTVALSGTGASTSAGATITPSSLTFPSTVVGSTSAGQMITLTNNTSAALSFGSTMLTGSGASSFLRSTTCGSTLAPGASCSNTVSFKPASVGTLTATITYSVNGSPQPVTLSGTGASASAGATITPSSLTFPSTVVGSTSAGQMITLTNNTSASLSFGSTMLTGSGASSFLRSTTCGPTLAPGASCTNTVSFKPASVGTLTATVTYSVNGSPQPVTLSGTGASASSGATITPSSLTFPSTVVGSTSAGQMITLTNNTSSSLSFGSTTLTGSGASSFLRSTTCGPTLAPGASCTNTVSFKPASVGTLTATVTYSVNGSPQPVTLSGTGANANSSVTITPSSLTFPSTTVGSTSAGQMITLTNNTSAAISFGATTVTGSGASSFLRSTTCGPTLAPGASCSNTVNFKPTVTGALAATVTYMANNAPQTVALYGSGQ